MSRTANGRALIAVTFDLEMCRNFPSWEGTDHWDYEKGNVDAATKAYTLAAAERIRRRGGSVHCFVLGRTLEQEEVGWLQTLIETGHSISNHTYDHVNLLAKNPGELQHRFRRAPWLIGGRTLAEVIADNIHLTNVALKTRVGVDPRGFRAPYSFVTGLSDRPDLQRILLDFGFTWVSTLYPEHPLGEPGLSVSEDVLQGIVEAQQQAQPFVYSSGLIELPMSPISDIFAFRNGRWSLESFLEAIRRAVQWTIDHGGTFDFLGHPTCLLARDPEFRVLDLICELVEETGDRAELVDLSILATRAEADH